MKLVKNCEVLGGSFLVIDDVSFVEGVDFLYMDVWYGLYEVELFEEECMKVFYLKY